MLGWYDVSPEDLNTVGRRVDGIQFLSRVRRYPEAEKKVSKRIDKVISADLFNLFYKDAPVIKDREEQPDPALGSWMEQLVEKTDYANMRMRTVRNVDHATIAAVKFYEDYLRHRDSLIKGVRLIKESKETANAVMIEMPDDAIQTLQALSSMQSSIGDRLDNEGLGDDEEYIARASEATDQTLQMVEAFGELDALAGDSYGFGAGGEEKLGLAFDPRVTGRISNQDQFRKIVNLMGRYKAMSVGLKAEKVSEKPVPTRVTQGNDLAKMVASEFSLLARPKTKRLFMKRFMEESLMQYDSSDEEPEGKGPVVILVDCSSSMNGKKQEIALAFTAELMRIALEQKRAVTAIQFESKIRSVHEMASSSDLIQFMQGALKASGGTSFEEPLNKSLDITAQGEKREADIVLITDGMGRVTPRTTERMLRQNTSVGTRYFGINVDGDNWPPALRQRLNLAMSCSYRSDKTTDNAIKLVLDQVVR